MLKFFGRYGFKKRKEAKKFSLGFLAFIVFGISLAVSWPNLFSCKNIWAIEPSDYCYKYDLNVVNTGASKDYYPVLLESVNQFDWVNTFEYIDPFGWSIYPYESSLADEREIMMQDLDSLVANQWYVVDDLSYGQTSLNVLLGANDIQRNQGMYFSGLDYTQTSHSTEFNTSSFHYLMELEDINPINCVPGPCIEQTILDKHDFNLTTGILIQLINNPANTTQTKVRVQLDNTYGDSQYFTMDGNEFISVAFHSGDLDIVADGVTTSYSGLTHTNNSTDIYIGVNETLSGKGNYLDDYSVRYISGQFGSSCLPECTPIFYYGYNPLDISQTSAVNPNYAGSVNDISGSPTNHNSNYFFNRDQTGISVSASKISSATASGSTIFNTNTTDIIGRWWGEGNPNTLATGNDNFLGLSFMKINFYPAGALKLPEMLWYSMWATSFGLLIAIGTFWIFKNVPVAMFGSAVPIIIFQIQGLLTPWYTIVYFLLLGSIYSTSLWVERS